MTVLIITDIPRMTDLFERFSRDREGLVVVNEIHRGIDELERIKPEVIILQNHLSGLSADILLKHLKSRIGRRRCRFVLISPSETLDVEISARFDGIMDPSQTDEELEATLDALTLPTGQRTAAPSAQTGDGKPETVQANQIFQEFPPESSAATESAQAERQPSPPLENPPEPLLYEQPRRQKRSVISAFSQQLDTRSEDLAAPQPPPEPEAAQAEHLREALHHRDELLITDIEESLPPLYRRGWVQALACTVLVAVVVTAYQHRSGKQPVKPPEATVAAIKPSPAAKPQIQHSSTSTASKPLAVHGTGRPKGLPAFVPGDSLDKSYGKEHPGWERYLGQANEYRLFREKNGAIRSIQVLDRSGTGIQESFYVTILKEVAGVNAMRPVSSEIKEGYEIRRGESGGLQVVQYRDAQGGRLRGVVVIWP